MKNYLLLILDMFISYFAAYFLLFLSGLFYFPERDLWAQSALILAITSSVASIVLTMVFAYFVSFLTTPKTKEVGNYTFFSTTLATILSIYIPVKIVSHITHFLVIFTTVSALVYLTMFVLPLTVIVILRASKHL